MRKKLAQQLRKKVYGDQAYRQLGWPRIINGQLQAHPLKQAYRKLKKLRRHNEYRNNRQKNSYTYMGYN